MNAPDHDFPDDDAPLTPAQELAIKAFRAGIRLDSPSTPTQSQQPPSPGSGEAMREAIHASLSCRHGRMLTLEIIDSIKAELATWTDALAQPATPPLTEGEAQRFIQEEYGPLLSREQKAREQLTVLRRDFDAVNLLLKSAVKEREMNLVALGLPMESEAIVPHEISRRLAPPLPSWEDLFVAADRLYDHLLDLKNWPMKDIPDSVFVPFADALRNYSKAKS